MLKLIYHGEIVMVRYNSILIILLMSSLFIPEVLGISVSVSEGNGRSDLSETTTFGAGIYDSVSQRLIINPAEATMSNHLLATGPVSASRSISGGGGYSNAGFSVNGAKANTSYEFTATGGSSATVTESLTSRNADDIFAFAYARDSTGAWAQAEVRVAAYPSKYSTVPKADLINYMATAFAVSNYATVEQSADSADGYTLTTKLQAHGGISPSSDNSYVQADMKKLFDGYPYYGAWTADAYASSSQTLAEQSFYGYGWPIKANAYAYLSPIPPATTGTYKWDIDYYNGNRVVGQRAQTQNGTKDAYNQLLY